MKITKIINKNTITYFYDGIKKYEYSKSSGGNEWCSEYKDGNEIFFRNPNGYETWSDDNPDNPNNKVKLLKEKDVKPFKFN